MVCVRVYTTQPHTSPCVVLALLCTALCPLAAALLCCHHAALLYCHAVLPRSSAALYIPSIPDMMSYPGSTHLVVTHKSLLRSMLCTALGLPPRQFRAIDLANGAVCMVR